MSALTAVVRRRGEPGQRWQTDGRVAPMVAAVFLATLVIVAVFAPALAPHSPYTTALSDVLVPPGSADHLLGTDSTGRDTLSRLIYGARLSLVAPLGVVAISTCAGIFVGLLAAQRGGLVDTVLTRIMDVLFAFPSLLMAMLAVAIFGNGLTAPIIALAIAYTPFLGRIVRTIAIQERSRPYVQSYHVMGFSDWYVTLRRVLPNLLPVILAQASLAFGYALIDLASLSYLGLGVQPPDADWGTMINQGQADILGGSPWSTVIPGVAILLTVVAVNIVGERVSAVVARRGGDRS